MARIKPQSSVLGKYDYRRQTFKTGIIVNDDIVECVKQVLKELTIECEVNDGYLEIFLTLNGKLISSTSASLPKEKNNSWDY